MYLTYGYIVRNAKRNRNLRKMKFLNIAPYVLQLLVQLVIKKSCRSIANVRSLCYLYSHPWEEESGPENPASNTRSRKHEAITKMIAFAFYITCFGEMAYSPAGGNNRSLMDAANYFPRAFRIEQPRRQSPGLIDLNLYRSGDSVRWEGYYMERRISLYWNGYYWIVEAYWLGKCCGYFRHYEEEVLLPDVERLVQAACFLIDRFLND